MSLLATLFKVYWAVRRVIAPTLRYSQYAYEDMLKQYVHPDTLWIDIGCGHGVLPSWRAAEERQLVKSCKRVVGIDYDLISLKAHPTISRRVRGNITKLPFQTESFDLVTANMVVEHLDEPVAQFREIGRVLRREGVLLLHTPNALAYGAIAGRVVPDWVKGKAAYLLEGREEEDVFRTYYRANTETAIGKLARSNGFEVRRMDLLVTDAIFAIIPPLAVAELMWIRMLMTESLRALRPNIIAVLQKTA